jgi:hypothetical protein
MKKISIWVLLSTLLLGITSCKDPFEPPVELSNPSFLVVEGYINGNGSTRIKLSRTASLSDTVVLRPELNAQVKIEGTSGSVYTLSDIGNGGSYEALTTSLHANEQYRIYIQTADNKEYVSEYVVYKATPTIDELAWEKRSNGVQVLLTTHDPRNQTRYYRWEFEETWELRSTYIPTHEWSETLHRIIPRDPTINIYNCWKTVPSKNILVGSSAKLLDDVITNYPLAFVPDTSWKLNIRYSILAKQYALTKEAYQYWEQLAKNTEQLGSIFDAQPFDLKGNISCLSDPKEPVIGFISAGTIEEKRIFIDHQEVPEWGTWGTLQENCAQGVIEIDHDRFKDTLSSTFAGGKMAVIEQIEFSVVETAPNLFDTTAKYTYAFKECVDCRTRGTNIKPSFW